MVGNHHFHPLKHVFLGLFRSTSVSTKPVWPKTNQAKKCFSQVTQANRYQHPAPRHWEPAWLLLDGFDIRNDLFKTQTIDEQSLALRLKSETQHFEVPFFWGVFVNMSIWGEIGWGCCKLPESYSHRIPETWDLGQQPGLPEKQKPKDPASFAGCIMLKARSGYIPQTMGQGTLSSQ